MTYGQTGVGIWAGGAWSGTLGYREVMDERGRVVERFRGGGELVSHWAGRGAAARVCRGAVSAGVL